MKVAERGLVCMANSRIAYYAGWPSQGLMREGGLEAMAADERCVWIVLEARKKENPHEHLPKLGLREAQRFENAAGDSVIIARRGTGR
jgi:hypothetical protein